ncbi:TonB-dependent receptor domain-containing protein [Variovorax sp. LjRoot130]|uniref:TonB-dependent receptor domain-containing protein n=1 Tax=Variovorax sp. LjRoot130 TaxID=3342261 RepID=UPI003F514E8A
MQDSERLMHRAHKRYARAGSVRGNIGIDKNGQAVDPQYSTALEAGLKLQTRDQRLGANLAVFDIKKTNVLTASDTPGFSVAAGEVMEQAISFKRRPIPPAASSLNGHIN